jgi:hypothetical protein
LSLSIKDFFCPRDLGFRYCAVEVFALDVAWHWLVVTDVSGQRIGSIFNGQAVILGGCLAF